jgi:hypothetical protein
LGRKGGYGPYGAAWADSNPLYGNGEPEINFLGGEQWNTIRTIQD